MRFIKIINGGSERPSSKLNRRGENKVRVKKSTKRTKVRMEKQQSRRKSASVGKQPP
jgi:hypothetical protein